ncbi:hypothetical protein NPIL_257771 [Nephila pilipes]|uniref:Uncharacterized protein n=1 Tax=Nephila pilipes TaxID=299642 RepID=A0A8X6NCN8_NEPPI|nr:hypothetical protein NPIL_257771 [Nephila pilipes]
MANYDLGVPRAEYLIRLDYESCLIFISMNCFPIPTELVDEEETRESIFMEFEFPELPSAAWGTLLQVGEQLNLHPRIRNNRSRHNLQTVGVEEINQSTFEEGQSPDLHVVRPQTTCIRIRDHLRTVVEFLRLKLGCQKNC